MKIRFGFVSNSSSSSFVIKNLTEQQKRLILEKNDSLPFNERWLIEETYTGALEFSVDMDNFQWGDFLWEINVDESNRKWLE